MAKVNYPEVRYPRQEPAEWIQSSDVVQLRARLRQLEVVAERQARIVEAAVQVVAAYRSDQAHKIYAAAGRLAAVLEVAE